MTTHQHGDWLEIWRADEVVGVSHAAIDQLRRRLTAADECLLVVGWPAGYPPGSHSPAGARPLDFSAEPTGAQIPHGQKSGPAGRVTLIFVHRLSSDREEILLGS